MASDGTSEAGEGAGEGAGIDLGQHLWDQIRHDLRQPMQALQLMASASCAAAAHGRILRMLGELEVLHEAMLRLARLATAPRPPGLVCVDIAAAARPLLRRIAAGRTLTVGALPPAADTDPEWFAAVLEGLVDFALDHDGGGGVTVEGADAGGCATLTVAFRAPEFRPHAADRAFVGRRAGPGGRSGMVPGPGYFRQVCALLGHRLELRPREPDGWAFRLVMPHRPG